MSQQNFKKQTDAQTFIPDEGYLALFYSTDLNNWVYKDEFGTTQLFVSESVIARSLYARVRNQTGSTVPALRVVYITGASGQLPLISLAQANTEATSSKTFAVTREGINNNSNGNVIVSGVIENVDTSAFAAGDLLWLSAATPGLITNVRPTQPDHAVFIGYCVSSNPTSGSIEVKIQNGYELDELHNVLITSVANKNVLKYDSATSLWKNGTIAKDEVGLGNVDNTSDANKPVSTATQTALDLKINSSLIGAANGVAPLDGDSKIPAIYIPGSIEEVLEFANLAAFPVTGVTSKLYVALDTNKVYRWSGSAYVEISASPGSTDAVPEGTTNLYFTEPRVRGTVLTGLSLATNAVISAADSVLSAFGKIQKQISDNLTTLTNHIANLSNPHAVTKTQVGLGNVDNTADLDKPISTATQTALDLKVDESITVSAGAGLSGGGDLSANRTISMPNTGTAGTYGSSTQVPVFTTDAQGRVTSVTNTTVTVPPITAASVSNTPAGNISATNVQAAINELDTEKANLAGGNTFTGNQTINGGLTVTSTTEGFLPPRVTSGQRAGIGGIGTIVYDTTVNALFVRVGGSINDWHRINEARTRSFNLADFATATLVIGNFEFRYSTNVIGGNLQVRALTVTQTINWYGNIYSTGFVGQGGARNDILASGFTSLTAVTYQNNYKGTYEIHNITEGTLYRVAAVLDNNATFTIRAEIF